MVTTATSALPAISAPPAAYAPRRLLVPFCGSGSEVISAVQVGWEEVTGIDQDAGYIETAWQRLAYWTGVEAQAPPPPPTALVRRARQLGLFP